MKAKQLKNSVLKIAMRGKLVQQIASEGSAESFYNKIQNHKIMLMKDKKTKSNSLREFGDKEQFEWDIPENWIWTTFGEITINRDAERIPLSKSMRENQRDKKYDYYGASGVIDKVEDYLFDKTLLLIGEDGANLLARSTPIAFLAKGKYWVNNHAHVIDGINEEFLEYLSFYINSISLADFVTGTAQPKMNQKNLNSIPVPLPPFEEQKRIITKIKEVFSKIEKYGQKYSELENVLNEFPEQLEKSILQYAMQGKLVKQDANDESTSELIKKIKLEKEILIREKTIKKDKPLQPINDDEIPFDIPSSWEWVRLRDLGYITSGGTPKTTESSYWNNGDIVWITPSDMGKNKGKFLSTSDRKITIEGLKNSSAQLIPKNSIVYSSRAPIGHINIVKSEYSTNQGCKSITPLITDITFLYYALIFMTPEIQKKASGTTFKEISGTVFGESLIPVPPLNEQIRIVSAIEAFLSIKNKFSNIK